MKNLITRLLGRYLNTMSYLAPRHAASLGFRIFCRPFRVPLKHYQHEFFNTAEQTTLNVDGVDVKVYRWNGGPKKILFLHGWESHSFRWKNYLGQFPREEYTLYALDAPGHGQSSGSFLTVPLYSEVVENFLLQHGPMEAVISHSLGSFTLLYTLHRAPLLPVGKLVLLASPGEATEFIRFYRSALRLNDRVVGQITEHFRDTIGDPVEYFSAKTFASKMKRPGLIIHDEEDDETSFEHSVAIHKHWKNSSLMLTKGYAHNLKSPEVLEAVANFVKNEPVRVPMEMI